MVGPTRRLLFGLPLFVATPLEARADPNRLFPDSERIVRDRISVEVVGKGPDVLLIPGLASSRTTWRDTAERLKDRRRLHLVQIAGFSGEAARGNAEGEVFGPTAEAIGAYIVEQRLAPATVIGHSLGGAIGLYLAHRHPERLMKVMVVDSLPFLAVGFLGPHASVESARPMADGMKANALALDAAGYAKLLEQQFVRMTSDPDRRRTLLDWSLASERSVVARAMHELMLFDMRPSLASLTTPLTVVYPDNTPAGMPPGMYDSLVRAQYAPAGAVRFALVEKALHFVMWDQPQPFSAAVDQFLVN